MSSHLDGPYPLFVSLGGVPINFRLVCESPRLKKQYISKITAHGGVLEKSNGRRIVLLESLVCEMGHYSCKEDPPFRKEPAFKVSWVDDCITRRALLDINFYLLNPSPHFTETNFLQNMMNDVYKPPPVLCPLKKPDPTHVEIFVRHNPQFSDNDKMDIIREACSLALSRSNAPSAESNASNRELASASGTSLSQSRVQFSQQSAQSLRVASPVSTFVSSCSSSSHSDEAPTNMASPAKRLQVQDSTSSAKVASLVSTLDSSSSDSDESPTKKAPSAKMAPPAKRLQVQDSTSSAKVASRVSMLDSSSSDSDEAPTKKAPSARRLQVQDSTSSAKSFGPYFSSTPAAPSKPRPRQNTRQPYCRSEEIIILRYIKSAKKFKGIRSDVIWKEMDGKPGLERRTWQSLKEHFIKAMLPKLESYAFFDSKELVQLRRTQQ